MESENCYAGGSMYSVYLNLSIFIISNACLSLRTLITSRFLERVLMTGAGTTTESCEQTKGFFDLWADLKHYLQAKEM